MKKTVPRIIISGTNSGCGKTTITCAILKAMVERGLEVAPFKCGPDYIDTMFHGRITGNPCSNLDLFFFEENTANYLLAKNSEGRNISVIEGVMGFYDGKGLTSTEGSTYDVAKVTKTPVILVVGAKGASLSVLATIKGFLDFADNNQVAGVILNKCTAMTYKVLAEEIEKKFEGKVKPLGFMPLMEDCVIESRHLGLVTAAEIENLDEMIGRAAKQAEETIDIDGIIELADSAAEVVCEEVVFPKQEKEVKIAVARDKAFCFYYEDSLKALEEMGGILVGFSPLEDEKLPEDIDGIYLGGGYPELYAEKLEANTTMKESIRKAIEAGVPCFAECGGFMYLTEEIAGAKMVGALKGQCQDKGKLTRFGYVTLTAQKDNMLCRKGESIKGHEFHHWDCSETGSDFTASKDNGRAWDCVVATDKLYAGYPHFHFYSNPAFAINFYKACMEAK